MTASRVDLADLFSVAKETIAAHQQEINDLDGYNANHGDNMTQNMEMIVEALQQRRDQPPAAALEHASQRLQKEGQGGTSQYYARGLERAADQLQGRSNVTASDALTLVQSLLGTIPSEGYPDQPQAGSSVLDTVLGMAQGHLAQQEPSQSAGGNLPSADQPSAGGLLDAVLGMAQGQTGQQQPAQSPGGEVPSPDSSGPGGLLDAVLGMAQGQTHQQEQSQSPLGGILESVVPAAMAYFQAQQSGGDATAAAGQALLSAFLGRQEVDPLESGTPRAAAGGLIAQSILKALVSRR